MILIPARNEGPRIGGVVDDVHRVAPGVPVVVVVNGTTDDTAEVQQAIGIPSHGRSFAFAPLHKLVRPFIARIVRMSFDMDKCDRSMTPPTLYFSE